MSSVKRLYYVGHRALDDVRNECRERLFAEVTLSPAGGGIYVEGKGQDISRFLIALDWGPSWSQVQGGKVLSRHDVESYLASTPASVE